jgi:hypothetical protein
MSGDVGHEVVLLARLGGQGLLPEDASLLEVSVDELRLEVDDGPKPVFLVRLGILGRYTVLGEGGREVVGRGSKRIEGCRAIAHQGVEAVIRLVDGQLDEVDTQSVPLGVCICQ